MSEPPGDVAGEVTCALRQIDEGDESARERLLSLVHGEVRRIAQAYLRRERPDHSLQPTEVVHEAYLRLFGGDAPPLRDRKHVYAAFARVIRNVLVDHARDRAAAKRGGELRRVGLSDAGDVASTGGVAEVDLLDLHAALERLGELDERQAQIVELRFFTGLSIEEVAATLEVGTSTVNRDWAVARAWLQVQLSA